MAAFEVIALDTATPQLRAPGASDTYTFPRAVEMPLGTANGVLYLNGSKVVTSGSALTFDGTNLGVGTASPTLLFQVGSRGGMDSTGIFRWGSALTGNNRGVLSWDTNIASIGAPQNLVFCANSETTERMRIDASGNLGLGVTPSAWNLGKAFEINFVGNSLWGATTTQINLLQNAYWNGGFKYANSVSSPASYYSQISGVHAWHTAPSGTAGNAISFTQAMTLDASGRLGIGLTNPSSTLDVYGTFRYQASSSGNGIVRFESNNSIGQISLQNSSGTNVLQLYSAADNVLNGVNNLALAFYTNNIERVKIPATGGMVIGTGAIATNATDGFFYAPGCAGTPTGTPTAYTGRVPIVVDTTNHKLYFYSGGAWRDAGP